MTTYPAWTPAPRPGIIPLHPLSFGTILGRSFAALRQNPRVLLGFALLVQMVSYIVVLAAVGGVAIAAFSRLQTVTPGSDDYNALLAGSVAITAIVGLVLGFAAGALTVIVQGVVVTEVTHAAVAEKLSLRAIWRQVRPAAWRLIGYTLLLTLAALLIIAVVTAAIVAIGLAALPVAIGLTILVVLAAIPLSLWLNVKLLLVPAAIILEEASIRQALARSWTLVRGRFWPALGIVVVIQLAFGILAQVVNVPFSLLGSALSAIVAPTGSSGPTNLIGLIVTTLLAEVVVLLIQSVALVVQATAVTLIYIDCRMRREGLDLDLIAYVEQRDAGATGLVDPYRAHIGRQLTPRPAAYGYPGAVSPVGYPPAYPTAQGYPTGYAQTPGYPPAPSYAQSPGYPSPPVYAPAPGYPPPPGYPLAPGYAQAPRSAQAPGYPPPPGHAQVPGYPPPPAYRPSGEQSRPQAPPAAVPAGPPPSPAPESSDVASPAATDATRWAPPGRSEDRESP